MARSTRTQSNAQESEAQRSSANTSPDSTSLTSANADSVADSSRLSAEDEQTEVQSQVDEMLGKEPEDDAREMISVRTKGPYLVHDMTTNYTVEQEAKEVPLSAFIQTQLDAERIEKA